MATAIWTLSSRNLEGVELVSSNEVHPYHLLRYDRAIFSQPAIEKLQVSLKNSASQAQAARRSRRKAARRPLALRAPGADEKAAEVA